MAGAAGVGALWPCAHLLALAAHPSRFQKSPMRCAIQAAAPLIARNVFGCPLLTWTVRSRTTAGARSAMPIR